MKTTSFHKRIGAISGVLCLFSGLTGAYAQTDLLNRSVIVPESPVYQDLAFAPEVPDYNMRLGPVDFSVGVGVALEWNDNVRLAPKGREDEDFILRPFVDLGAQWRLTELNTLNFNVGLSYAKYFDNSDLDTDGILVSPNSAISLQMYVGDFRITISDSFSYQEDLTGTPELGGGDGDGSFRRFENQIGIQVDWNANENLILTAGYTHYNLWALDEEEFGNLDRAIDTVYIRPSYQLTPTLTLGLNTAASWIRFDDAERGDEYSYFIGPFVDAQLSEYTSATAEVGYQNYDSDRDGSSGTIYARLDLNNTLTPFYTHRLGFQHSNEVGYGADVLEIYRVDYGATWRMLPYLTLYGNVFYENYSSRSTGGEDGDRLGASIGFGYLLTPSITIGTTYRYLYKDSNQAGRDYRQNSVLVSVGYRF